MLFFLFDKNELQIIECEAQTNILSINEANANSKLLKDFLDSFGARRT